MIGTSYVYRHKLYVSFAEYCLFYRALVQKRPMILRSVTMIGTPYVYRDKLYVSFVEYCLFYRALLEKRLMRQHSAKSL